MFYNLTTTVVETASLAFYEMSAVLFSNQILCF